MNSVILMAGSRVLAGLLLIFSVYMLLRGHNLPGGGFIGGLIGATGFILQALRAPPQSIAVVGLGIALAAGALSAFAGDAFLTGQWLYLAGLPLSTVLVFDIGVYLVVFGAVLTLVFALEEAV